jgi:hypothetical protein
VLPPHGHGKEVVTCCSCGDEVKDCVDEEKGCAV